MKAYNNLRKYIGTCLLEAYKNRNSRSYSLHNLLGDICRRYQLNLSLYDFINSSDSNRFQVLGKDGYNIIIDTLFIVKELEACRIIQYYRQIPSNNTFPSIKHDKSLQSESSWIAMDSYNYISMYWNQYIWVNPQIELFVNHNFISEELVEAKKQTRFAQWTFMALVIAVLLSVITTRISRNDAIDLQRIIPFYNYSMIDWTMMDTLYYRPYAADWSAEIDSRIHPEFSQEIVAQYWHRLQNAKTYFHQQTLPLRRTTSKRGRKVLDKAEAMFDTVFLHCVEQEYYSRLFVDVYNEIMPSTVDNLITNL